MTTFFIIKSSFPRRSKNISRNVNQIHDNDSGKMFGTLIDRALFIDKTSLIVEIIRVMFSHVKGIFCLDIQNVTIYVVTQERQFHDQRKLTP